MVNWRNIGKTLWGRYDGGELTEFEKFYGMPSGEQFSYQLRYGQTSSINNNFRGTVIRGVDFFGQVDRLRSDVTNEMTISLAPGATHGNITVSVDLSDTAKVPFTVNRPATSIPIGRFGTQPGDPNLNQWGGLSTSGIAVITQDPPQDAGIILVRNSFAVSEPPAWQFSGPTSLTVGQVGQQLVLRVAYSDEPVVGLNVRFTSLTTATQMQTPAGQWLHEVEWQTDANGYIRVPIEAISGGGDSISFRVADARSRSHYFSPNLDSVHGINSTSAIVGGVECVVVPPVAAVPPIPARIDYVSNPGWNAGANSVAEFDGDCEMKVKMDPVIGVVVGFTQSLENVEDYTRMTHAYYFHFVGNTHVAHIMESGRSKLLVGSGYGPTDEFVIRRRGTQVEYLVNDTLIFVSRESSAGMLNVGSSIYGTGDSI